MSPVAVMQAPLGLSWSAIFTLQVGAAAASGAIVASIEKSWLDFAIGLFIFPLATTMAIAIFTLLLYYYFILFNATYLDIRRLHALMTVAALPYFFLHSFSGFLAPLDLIGFALTCVLCVVGLVEQFALGKRPVFAFFFFAAILFFTIWSASQYYMSV